MIRKWNKHFAVDGGRHAIFGLAASPTHDSGAVHAGEVVVVVGFSAVVLQGLGLLVASGRLGIGVHSLVVESAACVWSSLSRASDQLPLRVLAVMV